jgi:hypothetical protein
MATFMNTVQSPLNLANNFLKQATYTSCHKHLSKQQILRSQLGFNNLPLICDRALIANTTNYFSII